MTDDPRDPEGIDAEVARWALDDQAAEAVRLRARSRRLVGLANENSTFGDLLETIRRRAAVVDMLTSAGRIHVGRIEMVGDDHIRLRTARGIGLITTVAVVQVSERSSRPSDLDPDFGPVVSPAEWQHAPVRFSHALERLTGTEVLVRMASAPGTQGAESVGEVEAVGDDYVVLRTETGGPPGRVYARLEAVAEAWPFMSG